MRRVFLTLIALSAATTLPASAEPLTAEGAVRIALQHSPALVQASAAVDGASAGLWGAYSGVLPRISGAASRSGSATDPPYVYSHGNSGGISGSWSVLSLSNWASLAGARAGMSAARLDRAAARADVILGTKSQFYEVVKAMHLARVSGQALRLSRDDERRVRALFEVGSVSKSDLLQAQVRTSQSELDSLLADHAVFAQRITLARQLGVSEESLGEVDSTLTATAMAVDAAAVLADARSLRPDVRAAQAGLRSAEFGMRAAQLARLPELSADASWSASHPGVPAADLSSPGSFIERDWSHTKRGTVSLSMPLFDLGVESGVARARSSLRSARESRDAVLRNLDGEVRQVLLLYREATEREALARRTIESASENLNLIQQKYNVGSATILDLIASQVQYQGAQNDLVTALAAMRVAEASIDRVRGRSE
ncbi:MAG: TolC family protein [Candidatus Eisenbacteria bacterium]|nr:TolC family protein [Candidatus Eisenbacteria bacterium]